MRFFQKYNNRQEPLLTLLFKKELRQWKKKSYLNIPLYIF
jgi:hypothetical protein